MACLRSFCIALFIIGFPRALLAIYLGCASLRCCGEVPGGTLARSPAADLAMELVPSGPNRRRRGQVIVWGLWAVYSDLARI